jgi:hypothetical protein
MNYKLSKHAIDVMSSRNVKISWVEFVLDSSSLVNKISTIESHYFSIIKENEDRCLKVVINPTTGIIVTAYFDRNMRKKGCK